MRNTVTEIYIQRIFDIYEKYGRFKKKTLKVDREERAED